MFTIVIQEKGGEPRRMVFNKSEITIGRVQGNDIVLPKGNVSKRHARIVLKDNKYIIVDLKSTNGTYVNGRKISSPLVVKDSDKIYIGDFIVGVDESGASSAESVIEAAVESSDVVPPPAPAPQVVQLEDKQAAYEPPRMDPPAPRAHRPSEAAPMAAGPAIEVPRALPPKGGAFPAPPPGPVVPPPSARASMRPPPGSMPPPVGIPSVGPAGIPSISPQAAPVPSLASSHEPAPHAGGSPMPSLAPPLGALGNGAASARNRPAPQTQGKPFGQDSRSTMAAPSRGVMVMPLDQRTQRMLDIQAMVGERVRSSLGLDTVAPGQLAEEAMWQRAERAIWDVVKSMVGSGEMPAGLDNDLVVKETINEVLGLGALEDLLADDNIDEVIVDRRDRIIIGKDGQLRASGRAFSSDDVVIRVIDRLLATSGKQLAGSPTVDVRLRDGVRLSAAVPPAAPRGPVLTLKKPTSKTSTMQELTSSGLLSVSMADYLVSVINARRNVLVLGAPGHARSLVVAAMVQAAPSAERLISVERVAELQFAREAWIALEAHVCDAHALGLPELLQRGLRLGPDRLVVGDICGRGTFDVLSQLVGQVDGVIGLAPGDSAAAGLQRLALFAGSESRLDEGLAKQLVAHAFSVVVTLARCPDGQTRVTSVDELVATGDGADVAGAFAWRDGAFVGAA